MPNRLDRIRSAEEIIREGCGPVKAPRPARPGETRHGKWTIYFDPPPIPYRGADWAFVHDDFDGAEDAHDNRYGHAASLEAAKAEIDEREAEERAA